MTAIKASNETAAIGAFLPPSVIMPCAAAAAPSGWLLCDGAEYSQALYPALYALISSTYNTQINPTTGSAWAAPSGGNFRVPDYRGTFLRGVGTPYQGDTQTLGGWQEHKVRNTGIGASGSTGGAGGHDHLLYVAGKCVGGNIGQGDQDWGLSYANWQPSANGNRWTAAGVGDHGHSVSVTLDAGQSETRPHNKGVNYIIKY